MSATLTCFTASVLATAGFTTLSRSAVSLGSAADFGVLGAAGLTNTGPTTVVGDIGLHPGPAITGFFGTTANEGPGTLTGDVHESNMVAQFAQADALSAFNALNSLVVNMGLMAGDLGGLTLAPGVYGLGAVLITGDLVLDGPGDYVFQIASSLTTASGSSVRFINGASASDVFWAVGSSATLGTDSAFAGNLIAQSSASLTTGASVDGRVIALTGAVTMQSNTIVPEPSTLALVTIGSLGLLSRRRGIVA